MGDHYRDGVELGAPIGKALAVLRRIDSNVSEYLRGIVEGASTLAKTTETEEDPRDE